jgi:hypothetical protein
MLEDDLRDFKAVKRRTELKQDLEAGEKSVGRGLQKKHSEVFLTMAFWFVGFQSLVRDRWDVGTDALWYVGLWDSESVFGIVGTLKFRELEDFWGHWEGSILICEMPKPWLGSMGRDGLEWCLRICEISKQ